MQNIFMGARLAWAAVQIPGTVQREICVWTKKNGLTKKLVERPAGYLVYCPRGHVVRLENKEQLRHYGVDGDPPIIDMKGLNDPRSPLGKMFLSQDEGVRRGAMLSMEKQVMMLATAKTGPILMPEQMEQAA